jgi:hypothetical protein
LTTSSPPDVALPNFDKSRDSEPGLVLARSGNGANESNPSKYQEWSFAATDQTISVQTLRIWAAAKDFDNSKTVVLAVFLMDCGGGCTVLSSGSATVKNASNWKQVNIPLAVNDHEFSNGHSLVVKVTATAESDDDMWLAFGTDTYDAQLQTVVKPTPTTTTTTSSTTTTTTTTVAPTTTVPEATTPTSDQSDDGPADDPQQDVGAPDADTETTPTTAGDQPQLRETPTVASGEGEGTDQPFTPRRQSLVLDAADTAGLEVFRTVRELKPAEGLGVVFATVAENIAIYWQAALATGGVASALLWVGLSRREGD